VSLSSAGIEAQVRGRLRELSAGFVSACLTLPLCVGAGVLAFAPLGPDHIARGAVAGLYGAIVGGVAAALVRRSSFVVTFPTTPICAIQAGLGASLLPLSGGPATFTLAMTLSLVLMGLWQALFALSGFSRLMRFVPHPVMAGFVSGVAVFVGWHQLPGLLGHRSMDEVLRHGLRLQHPLAAAFGSPAWRRACPDSSPPCWPGPRPSTGSGRRGPGRIWGPPSAPSPRRSATCGRSWAATPSDRCWPPRTSSRPSWRAR
jgi:MFS superfamily sulfate permease-like transporter